jgi:hypothetical protein
MNTLKQCAAGFLSIVTLSIFGMAGCAVEPTSDSTPDMDDESMSAEGDTDTAQSALTTVETTIQTEHRKIKASYNYNNSTAYSGQTLPNCALQELNKINSTGVWGHYACTAGKLKNLYGAASTASVPAVNWPTAINGASGWKNSPGHLATINGNSKVGCASIAGTQAMCKATFGASFPYCRIYSCAYSN